MSLINDALRRAKQEKKEQAQTPSDGAPMQPVHAPSRDRASFLGPILLTLIVLVLMMAAFLFWKGMQTKKELAATERPQIAQPIKTKPAGMEPPIEQAAPIISAPPTVATNESTSPVVTNAAITTNAVPPPVDPGPPPLKLQGIFYRPSNPTAMINGKTVAIGELVSGARVLKIDRQEVTLERAGKLEIITME